MGAHIDKFTVFPTSTDIYKPISIHVEAHVDLLEGMLFIERWYKGEKYDTFVDEFFMHSITLDKTTTLPYGGIWEIKVIVQEKLIGAVTAEDSASQTVLVSGPEKPSEFAIPGWVPWLAGGVLAVGVGAIILKKMPSEKRKELYEKTVSLGKKGVELGVKGAKKGIELIKEKL